MPNIFNQKKQVFKRRLLRNSPTRAEYLLWQKLSGKQLEGCRFRRQVGIGYYIVDFYCSDKRLVIEVDGGYHTEQETVENDLVRQANIEALGLRVLRFSNDEVIYHIDLVLARIKENLPLAKGELRG